MSIEGGGWAEAGEGVERDAMDLFSATENLANGERSGDLMLGVKKGDCLRISYRDKILSS